MTATTADTHGAEAFLELFERARPADGNGRGWLAPLRQAAIESFGSMGFPTTRDEQWRQTNVAPIAKTAFLPAPEVVLTEDQAAKVGELIFEGVSNVRLVFVNGRYNDRLSSHGELPAGVKAMSLAKALSAEAETVKKALGRCAPIDDDPFIALNTAFMQDGAFVAIPKGKAIEQPIHILYVTIGGAEPVFTCPRTLILAGEGSQSTILESHVGMDGAYFSDAVSELMLGEGAILDHYKIEEESDEALLVSTIRARQEKASNLCSHAILIGGRLVRNNITAFLEGEGIECVLNGLYLPRGAQHIDTHTKIEHAKPHCHSREAYRGILDDDASGVFNGYIHVHPDAQKTDAIQSNRALLLSDRATINTQPQLEIYADDVRCTHGATIGRLDDEAIFYLRSRGIGDEDARGLLRFAFANEIISEIKVDPVRERLERVLAERFRRDEK